MLPEPLKQFGTLVPKGSSTTDISPNFVTSLGSKSHGIPPPKAPRAVTDITIDKFRLISVLGRGHFGKVSHCRSN